MLANRLYWGPNTTFDQGVRGDQGCHGSRLQRERRAAAFTAVGVNATCGGTTPNRAACCKTGYR